MSATADYMFGKMLADRAYGVGADMETILERMDGQAPPPIQSIPTWLPHSLRQLSNMILQSFNCSRPQLWEILNYCRDSIEGYFWVYGIDQGRDGYSNGRQNSIGTYDSENNRNNNNSNQPSINNLKNNDLPQAHIQLVQCHPTEQDLRGSGEMIANKKKSNLLKVNITEAKNSNTAQKQPMSPNKRQISPIKMKSQGQIMSPLKPGSSSNINQARIQLTPTSSRSSISSAHQSNPSPNSKVAVTMQSIDKFKQEYPLTVTQLKCMNNIHQASGQLLRNIAVGRIVFEVEKDWKHMGQYGRNNNTISINEDNNVTSNTEQKGTNHRLLVMSSLGDDVLTSDTGLIGYPNPNTNQAVLDSSIMKRHDIQMEEVTDASYSPDKKLRTVNERVTNHTNGHNQSQPSSQPYINNPSIDSSYLDNPQLVYSHLLAMVLDKQRVQLLEKFGISPKDYEEWTRF